MKPFLSLLISIMFLLVLPIASAEKDFQIIDLVIGKGDEAFSGSYVTVHYVGKLQNGTKFDSSRDRNRPFEFNLGAGEVVKGWDKGIKGMRVGGKRKLIIPPELGYGSKRVGNIPPDSTLIFEVELLKIY
ncbi:FKBP-type peptidyl-prolyl cis-trans isomerase [Leptospira levettii]|uniref:Peptidyl-prolyl cis-trans isomerase n=2 Tax=Leptospira levettii TaxID=2023178 RepID=A0A5R2BVW6_9LEPT|nr:FKBP-type peptidyl-prolyl cis-trans isomerase [Leptospira levettii]PKA27398.1 peptidylprolyl isomerase [Leptospira sp. mixed culture ATI2-C-A1]MCG6149896.1 FKBP-type peptidyl-prolyl cis-trans isomerase [Leptospira levettii]MCW7466779.1 FKBP-type peptidyl-prolyl cis-trans isomerase [Leptospira levettii]MCW7506649.1 FKBP-type peptidyl-prolyl cis-trans isomerase [Leptospira levettii]MCW7512502.1 FKBP-type peptidyl-prolyl cis-trans isomerase [Leptospira levettii]